MRDMEQSLMIMNKQEIQENPSWQVADIEKELLAVVGPLPTV